MDPLLYKIAKEYHEDCDAFDETVCSAERKGEPFPVNHKEWAEVDSYARNKRKELHNRYRFIPAQDIDKAIQRYPQIK